MMGNSIPRGTLVVCIVVALSGCASFDKPADPQNAWLAGTWTNDTSWWTQFLRLDVGDGDKVAGTFELNNPHTKRTHTGSVRGIVDGDDVKLTVDMQTFSERYKINMVRRGEGLDGVRESTTTSETWGLTYVKEQPR